MLAAVGDSRRPTVDIWVWSLLHANFGEEKETLPILSADERQRADRFYFQDDRRRFVAARVGLRQLLAKLLETEPAAIEFRYGSRGKPALGGVLESSHLQFNVSHSGELAVAAITGNDQIGVDVELGRDCDAAQPIARRHFTSSEAEFVATATGKEQQMRFFSLWTAKEAVVKLLGSGLSFSLDRFETPGGSGDSGEVVLPRESVISRCWLTSIDVAQGYSACVATVAEPTSISIHEFDLGTKVQ